MGKATAIENMPEWHVLEPTDTVNRESPHSVGVRCGGTPTKESS